MTNNGEVKKGNGTMYRTTVGMSDGTILYKDFDKISIARNWATLAAKPLPNGIHKVICNTEEHYVAIDTAKVVFTDVRKVSVEIPADDWVVSRIPNGWGNGSTL